MAIKKRTYGFHLRTEFWASVRCVALRVLAREEASAYPINPHCDGESSFYGAPKAQQGMMLDGLTARLYLSESAGPIIFDWRIEGVDIDRTRAKSCSATFAALDRVMKKADYAGEIGEIGDWLEASAKAFGATWWAIPEREGAGRYHDTDWRFASICELKTKLRAEYRKLEDEHAIAKNQAAAAKAA